MGISSRRSAGRRFAVVCLGGLLAAAFSSGAVIACDTPPTKSEHRASQTLEQGSITDWSTPPESSGERFKMTYYILSRELCADGLKVAVFHHLRDTTGNGVNGPVSASTASQLENAILTRAREMRIARIAQ